MLKFPSRPSNLQLLQKMVVHHTTTRLTMATKRDHDSAMDSDRDAIATASPPRSNKRQRSAAQSSDRPTHTQSQPATDPTYGQRCAFPGLDMAGPAEPSDEEVEYEDDTDALAYLRSVR